MLTLGRFFFFADMAFINGNEVVRASVLGRFYTLKPSNAFLDLRRREGCVSWPTPRAIVMVTDEICRNHGDREYSWIPKAISGRRHRRPRPPVHPHSSYVRSVLWTLPTDPFMQRCRSSRYRSMILRFKSTDRDGGMGFSSRDSREGLNFKS